MSTTYCRHIRANGTRCRSIALARTTRCYWHRDLYQRHRALQLPDSIPEAHRNLDLLKSDPLMAQYYGVDLHGPIEFNFPPLEDRESIQVSLSMVLNALGRNRLEPKRAGAMLYTLQVASTNAARLQPEPYGVVSDTVHDELGHELAPDEDPQEITDANNFIRDFEAGLIDESGNDIDPNAKHTDE